MSEVRRYVKVLGLSLVVALSVTALGAVGAQAAGEFLIEEGGVKKTFAEHKINSSEFDGLISEVKFLTKGFTLSCQKAGVRGTAFQGGTIQVTILYEGCVIDNIEDCLIYETKDDHEKGSFEGYFQVTGTGELLLHANNHYVTIKGAPLGTIWLGNTKHATPNTCGLPLSVAVSGMTALKLPNALTPAVSQTVKAISSAEETSLKTLIPTLGLSFGASAAHLVEGEGDVHLIGPLLDKRWGAH